MCLPLSPPVVAADATCEAAIEAALEAHSNCVTGISNLAQAAVRDGRDDSRLVERLETISMEADGEWRACGAGTVGKVAVTFAPHGLRS